MKKTVTKTAKTPAFDYKAHKLKVISDLKQWQALLEKDLADNEGKVSGYVLEIIRGSAQQGRAQIRRVEEEFARGIYI
jgi:hypothetical protein